MRLNCWCWWRMTTRAGEAKDLGLFFFVFSFSSSSSAVCLRPAPPPIGGPPSIVCLHCNGSKMCCTVSNPQSDTGAKQNGRGHGLDTFEQRSREKLAFAMMLWRQQIDGLPPPSLLVWAKVLIGSDGGVCGSQKPRRASDRIAGPTDWKAPTTLANLVPIRLPPFSLHLALSLSPIGWPSRCSRLPFRPFPFWCCRHRQIQNK